MPGAYLWGRDPPVWREVLVDAAGHLITTPAAAAVFPSHCYGWSGAAWDRLLVESAANANLRTKLYDGVNPVVSVATGLSIAVTQRGLFTHSVLRGRVGANWSPVDASHDPPDARANAYTAIITESRLFGYNGATWDRLRVGALADAYTTPTFALEVMSFLMGYDGVDWNMVRVDAAGHLQTDVLSSALPTGAATAANQATIIGHIDGIEGALGQCYGYDGAAWQTLLVESDVLKNLRVRLYGGANAIFVGQSAAAFAYTNYGLATFAALYADDGTNLSRLDMLLAQQDALANTFNGLGVTAMLMGYNGSTWDRLRVDANKYLNVNVQTLLAGATLPVAEQGTPSVHLHAYDGANWHALRTTDATRFNLRTQPYYYQFVVGGGVMSADIADADYGLYSHASLQSWNLDVGTVTKLFQREPADALATSRGLNVVASLIGYNGSTWDRLRTYGVGILKVGRAEIDSTTVRHTAAGAVVAGAHNLYWVACSPDSPSAEWELSDDLDGSTAAVYDHFDSDKHSEHLIFDPPMKFSTGIYIKKFDHMHSLVFCYV